ncbi:MAG: endonuclease III [Pirellulales bacterium]|nr:endonuclease III [Pirellulales bacterium]
MVRSTSATKGTRTRGQVGAQPRSKSTAPRRRDPRQHAATVLAGLERAYPDAHCALRFSNSLELLIATILSAQCTDQRVNLVTVELFRKYRSAADYARAPLSELERAIQSTGFFRNKAKNIQACCQRLVSEHGGRVPRQMEDLVQLPGVGRKTANVVLGTAFGIASGVVVDTHVGRLSLRLGLTKAKQPQRVEQDLMAVLPRDAWVDFSHRMIHHGRAICTARKPKCDVCPLAEACPRVGVKSSASR